MDAAQVSGRTRQPRSSTDFFVIASASPGHSLPIGSLGQSVHILATREAEKMKWQMASAYHSTTNTSFEDL